jgi:hypothetical protein
VEQMNGSVAVESEPGKDFKFPLLFPLVSPLRTGDTGTTAAAPDTLQTRMNAA